MWRKNYSLGILTLVFMVNTIDRQLIGVVLEPMKKEFNASDTQMGLIAGLWFAFFYAASSIPIARLADGGNRRNILATCCSLWSFMTILCGATANYWQLVLARMGVAIGEAGCVPASLSMIADYYPKAQRPLAISLFTGGSYTAALISMVGGAWIAHEWGWRVTFFSAGTLGVLFALVVWASVSEPHRGESDISADNVRSPLLPTLRKILSSAAFRYIMIANGVASFWIIAVITWNISFLMRSHGLALKHAGLLTGGLLPLSMITGVLFSGWLCTRMGRRDARWQLGIPLIGACATMLMSFAYFLWPAGTEIQFMGKSFPQITLPLIGMCFFASWIQAASFAALTNIMPAHQRSVANATYVIFYTVVGFGLGPVLVGILSDALTQFSGKEALRHALAALTPILALSMAFYGKSLKPYLEESR